MYTQRIIQYVFVSFDSDPPPLSIFSVFQQFISSCVRTSIFFRVFPLRILYSVNAFELKWRTGLHIEMEIKQYDSSDTIVSEVKSTKFKYI